jgi:hypothetical protein
VEAESGSLVGGREKEKNLNQKNVSSREREKQDERKMLALKAPEGVPREGQPKPQPFCQGRKL